MFLYYYYYHHYYCCLFMFFLLGVCVCYIWGIITRHYGLCSGIILGSGSGSPGLTSVPCVARERHNPSCWLRVSGFGLRVSGFGFRV